MLRFAPSRILRAASTASQAAPKPDWGKTLNLPRSSFPARPTAAQLDTYRSQCADELYAWQRANRPRYADGNSSSDDGHPTGNEFVLHDGPPYANGAVHAGHALNKILKDIIVRSELGQGKRVRYQPGWDCHGLPIELKALQARASTGNETKAQKEAGVGIPPVEIRRTASTLASKTIDEQRAEFRSWGVMGEWDAPYKTMDKEFEIRQLGVFREMVKKGLIFRDHRPVYWSPSSRTALAEAELEYDDRHDCTAAFVKMPFVKVPDALTKYQGVEVEKMSALIWTTTPWTLPANKAVAFNKEIEYTLIKIIQSGMHDADSDQLLLAKDRIEHVLSFLPEGTTIQTIIDTVPGSHLVSADAACYNVFQGQTSRFIAADFVTATSGTGLVHMAPGHGMEDYQVCQKHNITPAFAPVDDKGCFTPDVFPTAKDSSQLQGLFAEKKGGKTVLEILSDPAEHIRHQPHNTQSPSRLGTPLLLASHPFAHKNPIDWRTKQPVITRATAQWFADVSLIKDRALLALESVTFVPESGRSRLKAFIEGRSQWCISRQRAWGVPIPTLYHKETGEACISDESIGHVIKMIEERGTDAWFADAEDDPAWVHPSLEPAGQWVRGKDTMDVWFDSGTTWTSLPARQEGSASGGGKKALADVYVEGSDQHRGWFQSSLLTAVATQDPSETPRALYGTLITHGFILDGEGRKMSKSLGNVISPSEIVSGALLQQKSQPSPSSAAKKQGKGGKKNHNNVAKAGKDGQVPVAEPVNESTKNNKKKKQDSLGPDLLRLWVASSDYTRDVPISQQGLLTVQQALQKYRVTLKFLCGVLQDYHPPSPSSPAAVAALTETHSNKTATAKRTTFASHALLHRLSLTSARIRTAYASYKFHEAIRELNSFVNTDLSAFYLEIAKDALYAGTAVQRQQAQGVLAVVLREMMFWLKPVTPMLVVEARGCLPETAGGWLGEVVEGGGEGVDGVGEGQVLRGVWSKPFDSQGFFGDGMGKEDVEGLLGVWAEVSKAVKGAQETARARGRLGSGLACRVNIVDLDSPSASAGDRVRGSIGGGGIKAVLSRFAGGEGFIAELSSMLVVSEVTWDGDNNSSSSSSNTPSSSSPSPSVVENKDTEGDPDWRFEALVKLPATTTSATTAEELGKKNPATEGEVVVAKVQILPPRKEKCVRCWNYVAEETQTPCRRCLEALAEKGVVGLDIGV